MHAFLGQKVHYYMVYIAYFTELNLQIDYAQKRRICRENCKYPLNENFQGFFCPRRKAAKFCHPAHLRGGEPVYLFPFLLFNYLHGRQVSYLLKLLVRLRKTYFEDKMSLFFVLMTLSTTSSPHDQMVDQI